MSTRMAGRAAVPRSSLSNAFGSTTVALVMALLAVVMTWPLAARLGTHVPYTLADTWVHFWTFHWVKQSLLLGHSPYFTSLLYYPEGASLYFHNIAWVNIAAWLPLQALFGEAAAYSLVFIAVIAFNGFAGYLFAREETGSLGAGFIAGLIVAFWPASMSHSSHPSMMLLGWIPLAMLYLRRWLGGGPTRDLLLAASFAAMVALTRWQLAILSAPLFALYAAYVMTQTAQPVSSMLARLAVVAVVASALTAPVIFPLVRAQQNEPRPEAVLVVEEAEVHADLLGYFLPSRFHPTWGALVQPLYGRLDAPNVAAVHTIGFTVMVLAALGVLASSRQAALWGTCAVLYLVLSLGSTLTINGHTLGATMPYGLVSRFFIMKLIRSPDRFGVLLSIPVALSAAWGVFALQRGATRRPHALVAGLAFLVLAEYAGAYPTAPLQTPEWCKRLAAEPGVFGILNLPMGARAPSDKTHMFYQLTHGKPLVEGHVSRPPPSAFAFIETVPLLRELAATGDTRPPQTPMDAAEQMRLLVAGNVRYVIADKHFLAPNDLLAWRRWLGFAPAYEDDDVAMYRTAGAVRDDEPAALRAQ